MGAAASGMSDAQKTILLNSQARGLVLARSQPMEQNVFQQAYAAGAGVNISQSQPVVTVNPRNVGLVRGFWVNILATITNGSGVQINLTDFGAANILSQIQFNDLSNNTRIQTTGWHLNMINSIKARRPFGSSLVKTTGFAPPAINYGNNWIGQISADATIAAAATGTVNMWFWVPLAYSENDLRGAIYLNVLNAQAQLNLTFNPVPTVANGADSTNAVYVGNSAGAVGLAVISAATVTVYQNYFDQLPTSNGQVLLPVIDLATIYELKQTTLTGVVSGQDFPIQYSNYRSFLSQTMIYVNTGSTGARGVGADINYWSLQAANFTNIWKKTPSLIALQNRQHLQTDPPPGMYYFGTRQKPIETTQYGNMQIILNALTAGAGAYVMVGSEDFGLVQTLSMAGSLSAN